MKRNFTLLFIALMCLSFKIEAQELTQKSWNITFETDKYLLLPSHESILEEVLDFIQSLETPPDMISIEGHTDNVGNYKYNKKLSDKRANSVRDFLLESGLSEEWITINGLSYSDPVADNQSESNRSKNRRTEIVVVYHKMPEPKIEIKPIVSKIDSITKPEAKLKPEPKDDFPKEVIHHLKEGKQFKYRCGQDITIIGFQGVEIQIANEAIKNCRDGMEITADVKALITQDQIMRSMASTRSGNKLLRSAGMVFVNLYANGRALNVNGCSVIYIPGPKVEGMQPYLFRGYRGNSTNLRNINWRLQTRNANINYDDERKAYRFEYCGNWGYSGGLGCNADVLSLETVITKIRRNSNLKHKYQYSYDSDVNARISVTYEDGAVTNLVPFYTGSNRLKKWWYRKYYYFPLTKQPARLEGSYTSIAYNSGDLLMNEREKTFKTNKKVKIRYKKNGKVRGLVKRRMNGRKVYKLWNWRYRFTFKSRKICWKNGRCKEY